MNTAKKEYVDYNKDLHDESKYNKGYNDDDWCGFFAGSIMSMSTGLELPYTYEGVKIGHMKMKN